MDTTIWLAGISAFTAIMIAALPLVFSRLKAIQTLGEETHKLANSNLTASQTLVAATKKELSDAVQQISDLKMMIMAGRTGGAAPAPATAPVPVEVEVVNEKPLHVDQVDKPAKEKP